MTATEKKLTEQLAAANLKIEAMRTAAAPFLAMAETLKETLPGDVVSFRMSDGSQLRAGDFFTLRDGMV
jgi:hypothetical protein